MKKKDIKHLVQSEKYRYEHNANFDEWSRGYLTGLNYILRVLGENKIVIVPNPTLKKDQQSNAGKFDADT